MKGAGLLVEVADDLREMVVDEGELRQCLINLVSNAAKFTERGTIRLTVACDGDRVAFTVADTGIGMTEEQLGRVFDTFAQADASTTRKYGSTGLGLTITRRLVELMRGTLEARSTLGEGTVFDMALPQDGGVDGGH